MAPGITLPEPLGIIMDLSLQNTCEIRELLVANCSRQQGGDNDADGLWLTDSPCIFSLPFRTETLPGRKVQNEGAIRTSFIISSSFFTACPVWWNWLS